MVEIFNDAFAGIVTRKQGDALEDFKMTAERNGITVCAPGTCTIKIDITIISIYLFIYFLFATQTKIEILFTAQFFICIQCKYAVV